MIACRAPLTRAALTLVVLGLMACGSKDPLDRVLLHAEAMVDLLEAHKDDATAAGEALEQYIANNRAALDEAVDVLNRETQTMLEETMRAGDDPEAQKALQEKMESRMGRFNQRAEALERRQTRLFETHPELRDEPRVKAAMENLGQGMR